MTEKRIRRHGLQEELIGILRQNIGQPMTINALMQQHPAGTTLQRGQISSAMNHMVNRGTLAGLEAAGPRGTWIYKGANAAAAKAQPSLLLIEVVATDPNGRFIGVDKENAGVYRMERIA
jgi:hypothetical protein